MSNELETNENAVYVIFVEHLAHFNYSLADARS